MTGNAEGNPIVSEESIRNSCGLIKNAFNLDSVAHSFSKRPPFGILVPHVRPVTSEAVKDVCLAPS